MSEFSNEMQPPHGDDTGREALDCYVTSSDG